MQSADAQTRAATLDAKGNNNRGQGGAQGTIVNRLTAADGGTRVDPATEFTITGRLARIGRGRMIKDISNRRMRDFAACLQARLVAESEEGRRGRRGRRQRQGAVPAAPGPPVGMRRAGREPGSS